MSSIPFPDLPSSSSQLDDLDNLQATTPTGDGLLYAPPAPIPSMLHQSAPSPSLNHATTPAESEALSIHYQSSDFSELDVEGDNNYFNAIFDSFGRNATSFFTGDVGDAGAFVHPFYRTTHAPAASYSTPKPAFGDAKVFPLSPDQTPSMNTSFSPQFSVPLVSAKPLGTTIGLDPGGGFDGLVSPHQLSKVPPTDTAAPLLQALVVNDISAQLTPDTASSGGSLGGANNDRNSLSTDGGLSATTAQQSSSMTNFNLNPHVTVSLWGKDDAAALDACSLSQLPHDSKSEHVHALASDSDITPSSPRARSWHGLDTLTRPSTELPATINEDAALRDTAKQNNVVSQWLDSAGSGVEPNNTAAQNPIDLSDPLFHGVSDREVDASLETRNIEKGGRIYLKDARDREGPFTATDYEVILQSTTVWSDRVSILPISKSAARWQPESSQAAIERFERMYHDNASIVSRAATWGTRRRSLPSIADIAEVTSGNILKQLSITRDRRPSILGGLRTLVRKPSTSQQLKRSRVPDGDATSYFDDWRAGGNEAGDGRRDSTNTLSLPRTQSWGKNKQPVPSINTALISMGSSVASIGTTHARSGSVSARSHAGSVSMSPPLTSPKSPLLKVSNSILRPRSRSEARGTMDSAHPNLVRMLKKTGGPPVASLATANATPAFPGPASYPVPPKAAQPSASTPPMPAPIQIPATKVVVADQDADDVDDEEDVDDSDIRSQSDELIDDVSPDLNGFRKLVIGLNPLLADVNTYLVDRIAHQQIVRYKGLLNNRVKHLGHVKGGLCPNGPLCIAQGGSAVMLGSRGARRNVDEPSVASEGAETDDLASPLDGAISAESFPKYIPMPLTSTLPAEFECQLCFQIKKPQKPSDWTKHVHEDVQPFTCTWDHCREPKMFKRKADWVRHENEGHRHLEWWTCNVDDCRHTCYRRDNFLQHLVREHKYTEPQHKTKAAIKRAGTTDRTWQRVEQCHVETKARPQDERCRFCGKTFPTWKKLTVHLAKHMEHISLPILRLVGRKDVEADTIISPVADPPPRPFAPTIFPGTGGDSQQTDTLGIGTEGLASHMMNATPVAGVSFHEQHLVQPVVAGYAPTGVQDTNSFMYPATSQVTFQQPFYGQSQFGTTSNIPSHMQSLNAAAMEAPSMGAGFGDMSGFGGQHPTTTDSFMGGTARTQYMTETSGLDTNLGVGIDTSSYQSLPSTNDLGLQATPIGASLLYDTRVDQSVSSGGQFTPRGSVSPYGHSHQPQNHFYGA